MNSMETLAIKEAIRERDGRRCADCGKSEAMIVEEKSARMLAEGLRHNIQVNLHVHRVIPDGPYSFENCRTLCPACHSSYRRDYTGEWPKRSAETRRRNRERRAAESQTV